MKRLWIAVATLPLLLAGGVAGACSDVLDHTLRRLGADTREHLCQAYQGQVLLVVNTASRCGFTPQYDGLETLHDRYSGRGFAVLGFPSNDFAGQEPGTEDQIKKFCRTTYGVRFPMFEKVSVVGPQAAPLYQDLARAGGGAPGWNFHKYLLDHRGRVVASFPSRVEPADLAPRIEALLEERASVGDG